HPGAGMLLVLVLQRVSKWGFGRASCHEVSAGGPRETGSVRQRIVDDVETHAQRLFALFGRIVMNVFILETITEVGVVRIEYNQPSLVNNPVALRGAAIVLMNLRQSAREFVKAMKNRMRIRDFDERCLGKDAPNLATEGRIDPEIVVHPPKPPGRQGSATVRPSD